MSITPSQYEKLTRTPISPLIKQEGKAFERNPENEMVTLLQQILAELQKLNAK